jgi:DNA-binding NarL/FixJ family response regulator
VRVVLADNQDKVRSALRLVIDQDPGFDVVEEVEDSERLMDVIEKCQPDLLILDWDLLEKNRNLSFRNIEEHYSDLKVVVLSSCILNRQNGLACGAHAFISKVDPVEKLMNYLQNLSNGNKGISSSKKSANK